MVVSTKKPQLFLDCDGVLADFNKRAIQICGMEPRQFEDKVGEAKFWDMIYGTKDFFYSLDPMPDAHELVDAVKHLNPIILTGRPRGDWSVDQKLRWRDKWFPELPMIVCKSREKITYAQPGDIIVDDWLKWRKLWVDGGGIWVHHTSAQNSIRELKELGVL